MTVSGWLKVTLWMPKCLTLGFGRRRKKGFRSNRTLMSPGTFVNKLKLNLLTNVPTVSTFRKRPILCNAPLKTFSLTENQFSRKAYFCTIHPCRPAARWRPSCSAERPPPDREPHCSSSARCRTVSGSLAAPVMIKETTIFLCKL